MAKILWIIHGYPPQQNAGAEWMAKEINEYLINKGHEIVICVDNNKNTWANEIEFAEVVITHLDWSQEVTEQCQRRNKPCINIIHHNWEIPHLRQKRPNVYCVYNSEWVKKDRDYPQRSLVMRPPVNPSRFKDIRYHPDGFITLVNCNKDKGALIFQSIARACPDLQFLAVKGHHGPQIVLKGRNIIQWECQEDIRKVFEVTSILLVPSVYESYGRIGIEAMACGIPVIASDTPGLRESLGDRGVFSSREFLPSWLHNIRSEAVLNNRSRSRLGTVGYVVGALSYKSHAANLWEQSLNELSALNDLINEITS